jgi:hypothetical protein
MIAPADVVRVAGVAYLVMTGGVIFCMAVATLYSWLRVLCRWIAGRVDR